MLAIEAPPKYVPIKEYLLLISLILITIIIILYLIRLKGASNKKDWNTIISLILAAILIFTIIELATYEEPHYYFKDTFDFQIELVNSSGGYNITDFWIIPENNETTIYTYENTTHIYGLTPGIFESIEVRNNQTSIFWGNNSIIFNSYFRYNKFVLYYQNTTGEYLMFEITNNIYPKLPVRLFFTNNESWVEFNIWVYEGPV